MGITHMQELGHQCTKPKRNCYIMHHTHMPASHHIYCQETVELVADVLQFVQDLYRDSVTMQTTLLSLLLTGKLLRHTRTNRHSGTELSSEQPIETLINCGNDNMMILSSHTLTHHQ